MIDKTALAEDLRKVFVRYQFRLDHPFPQQDETEQTAILKYRGDSIFHAKVDALVYGVMNVVDRHV